MIARGTIRRYRAAYSEFVLRLVFSPRWIMWHLLTLGAVVTCGLLAAWQWHRAGSAMGSALNIGYGLQWPLFALFFAVMWFRMLRLELRRAGGEQPDEVPPPPGVAASESSVAGPSGSSGSSPFRARPAVASPLAPPVTDETDPELAAYNRMLAQLAQHDQGRRDRTRQDQNRNP